MVSDGELDSSSLSRSIDLTAVNDAPQLSAIESFAVSYVENSSATAITSDLSVAELDDTHLEGAVVSITAGYQSTEDVLSFIDTAGISGSWNAATGELTLTGTATIAAYEAALRTVSYQNTSDNPDTNIRTISFVCLLYTSPSPRDRTRSRMPSSA